MVEILETVEILDVEILDVHVVVLISWMDIISFVL